MAASTFIIIIFSAVLHAGWNAVVKGGEDKLLQMTAVCLGHIPFSAITLFFVPPLDFTCLPYLIFGAAFHFGYQVYLVESYKKGDLSQVYPIARASAPLIATIISVLFLKINLELPEIIAIIFIIMGLISTVGLRIQNIVRAAVISAIITGIFIASYSLVDGYGGRVGGSPVGYYCWLSLINGPIMLLYCYKVSPSSVPKLFGSAKWVLFGGGLSSFAAYCMVMWAFSKAPIAVVMAVRETSIIFAFIIGILFLKEKLNIAKTVGTILAISGIIILRSF